MQPKVQLHYRCNRPNCYEEMITELEPEVLHRIPAIMKLGNEHPWTCGKHRTDEERRTVWPVWKLIKNNQVEDSPA